MNAPSYAPNEATTFSPDAAAATRVNFFARPARGTEVFPLPRFTAWLNHTDRIISLPSHWELFAAMIGEPGLERDAVLGRPVGWFVHDETARELARVLLERTRRDGRPVRIAARCDGQDESRAMQLRLVPMSAGAIECSWSFLQGPPALEIPGTPRAEFAPDEHVRMCSWCRRIHHADAWISIEAALPGLGALDHGPMPAITHGICPHCAATAARSPYLRAM